MTARFGTRARIIAKRLTPPIGARESARSGSGIACRHHGRVRLRFRAQLHTENLLGVSLAGRTQSISVPAVREAWLRWGGVWQKAISTSRRQSAARDRNFQICKRRSAFGAGIWRVEFASQGSGVAGRILA